MTSILALVLLGTGTTLALITAIGAQNAFVLRQALLGRFIGPIVLFCIAADALLYGLGVGGMGLLVQRGPWVIELLRWGGVAFLLGCGVLAARRALIPAGEALVVEGESTAGGPGLGAVLLTCAAMTFLNPHTYLDTVVLVGSVANQQGDPGKWWFFLGAVLGSTVWFAALGWGARLLRPLFARPGTWRVLDGGIAVLMFVIALRLMRG